MGSKILGGSCKTPRLRKIDDFGDPLSESAGRFEAPRREHTQESRRAAAPTRGGKSAVLRGGGFWNWLLGLCLCASQIFGLSDFSFNLAKEMSEENWLFSPFSITSCLSMVYAGANGETADEMVNALGIDLENPAPDFQHTPLFETDFQLNMAQGVWVRQGFPILSEFQSHLTLYLQAAFDQVVFSPFVAAQINMWIADQTNQKIQDLISPDVLNENTRLVLANALYFQGCWNSPFDPRDTALRPFFISPENILYVDTMEKTGRFLYAEEETFQALAISFARNREADLEPICLFILPTAGAEIDRPMLESALASLTRTQVHVQIPKFTVEQKYDLSYFLPKLGMSLAFTPSADFSGINGQRDLFLSSVLHKTFFCCDEKGVEATAATAAIMNVTAIPSTPEIFHSFIADRPFYFLLMDRKSETLFFIGHIQNPSV